MNPILAHKRQGRAKVEKLKMGTEANEGYEEGRTKNRALRYLLCSWVKMRGFLMGQLAGSSLICVAFYLTKNKNTHS